jgi:putative ABC transport system permease protein
MKTKSIRWTLYLVYRSLTDQLRRTLLLVAALALTALLVAVLVQLTVGMGGALGSQFNIYGANLVVEPRDAGLDARLGDYRLGAVRIRERFSATALDGWLAAHPDLVDAHLSVVEGTARLSGTTIRVKGHDLESLKQQKGLSRLQGGWPAKEGEVLLGRDLAKRLDLAPGATLEPAFGDRTTALTVSGIVETGSSIDREMTMDRGALQDLLGCEGRVNEASLWVKAPAEDLSAVAAAIEKELGDVRVRVVRQAALATQRLVTKVSTLLLWVTLAVMTATGISVMSTRGVVVLERRAEFGLLCSIGVTRATVARLLLGEALAIGTLAAAIGLPLGVLASIVFCRQIFDISPGLVPHTAWISPAVVWAVCIAGSLVPVRGILREEPAALLKE